MHAAGEELQPSQVCVTVSALSWSNTTAWSQHMSAYRIPEFPATLSLLMICG